MVRRSGGIFRRKEVIYMIKLRPYQPEDCTALLRLFYETVHSVNLGDYTAAQCNVWATGQEDADRWNRSLSEHTTIVAEWNGVLAGFGDMDTSGYLDRLYVSKDHQRLGIATAICDALERQIAAPVYQTHASITAKPFFIQRGYCTIREQQVERQGIYLTNYVMEKLGQQ